MSERRRDFDERDDLDERDDERRPRDREQATRREEFDDDGPDLGSRRDARRRDLDDEEDDPVEPEPPRPSPLARLILPVGGGILAGVAVLSAAVVFLGGDAGQIAPTAPQIVATGPQLPPAPQMAPTAPAPASGLAPGFGQQQMAQVAPPRPTAPAPVASAPGQPPAQPPGVAALPSAPPMDAPPMPMPVTSASPARTEDSVIRGLTAEVQAFRERVAGLERLLQEQTRRMSDLNQDMSRQRQGNQALLAGIADLRAEIDEREAEIERLRSAMQRVMVANAAQEVAARAASPGASPPSAPAAPAAPAAQPAPSAPAAPAAPQAQEQRRPPVVQIPVRFANFNGFTRLTLAFPAEPVYDVDQAGDEVRVRFLGGELPSLLGLPAQIRNIESISTMPGMMEIRVAEGVPVRHAMLGSQVALSFYNRGTTPPETAGAAPRPRRPESTTEAGGSPAQEPRPPRVETPAAPVAAPAPAPVVPPAAPRPAAAETPQPSRPPAAPPAVAQVDLSGLRLRSVSRRAVLIETEDGEIHRVELGQTLPGVSAVAQEVRRDGDVWVLVTSGGILRP